MAVIFQVRGTSLDAYYATFAKTPGLYGDTLPVVTPTVSAGIFGDSYIAKANGVGTARGLLYPGFSNTPNTTTFSFLWRIIPRWASGAPAITTNLVSIAGYSGSGLCKIDIALLTTGKLRFRQSTANQGTLSSADSNTTFTGWVQNQAHDIMVAFDGTNTTTALRWSVDGVQIDVFSPGMAAVTPNPLLRPSINLAMGVDTNHSNWDLNEFVIFNSVENHVYAARSDFWSASSYEGFVTASSVKTGVTFPVTSSFDLTTGTYDGSDRWSDPGAANVLSGTSYLVNAVTTTGTYHDGSYTDPGTANVRQDTTYIFNDVTMTGSLLAPVAASGTAGTVDINNIKESIRYILDQANTTTASPVDLSSNLTNRVQHILKVNPERIKPDAHMFPCVTIFTSGKSIEQKTIAKDLASGKRMGVVSLSIVAFVWNDNNADYRVDEADEDVEVLMENIELVLRHHATLNNSCTWQLPDAVTYHNMQFDEQAHLRVGILELKAKVLY